MHEILSNYDPVAIVGGRKPRSFITYVYTEQANPGKIETYGSGHGSFPCVHEKANRTIVVGPGVSAEFSVIWDPSLKTAGNDRRKIKLKDFTPKGDRMVTPHGEIELPDGSVEQLPLQTNDSWVELPRDLGHARYTFDNPYKQER